MDPTAALRDLLDALRNRDRETTVDRPETLLDWWRKGGAIPTVPEPEVHYQGWASHATWAVQLWLSNDHGSYLFCRRLAREAVEDATDCDQVRDGIWTADQARRFNLADRLKEYLAELNPLKDQPSLFSDLLTASLQDVNSEEVADAFLEDLGP